MNTEQPTAKGRQVARAALLAAAPVLVAPTVALAAAPHNFRELAATVVNLLNAGTGLLIVLAIVVYFYGVSTNVLKFSEEGAEKLKAYFFWGIIVLFVMVSIWGIVQLLQQTIFGNESGGGPAVQTQQGAGSDFGPIQVSE